MYMFRAFERAAIAQSNTQINYFWERFAVSSTPLDAFGNEKKNYIEPNRTDRRKDDGHMTARQTHESNVGMPMLNVNREEWNYVQHMGVAKGSTVRKCETLLQTQNTAKHSSGLSDRPHDGETISIICVVYGRTNSLTHSYFQPSIFHFFLSVFVSIFVRAEHPIKWTIILKPIERISNFRAETPNTDRKKRRKKELWSAHFGSAHHSMCNNLKCVKWNVIDLYISLRRTTNRGGDGAASSRTTCCDWTHQKVLETDNENRHPNRSEPVFEFVEKIVFKSIGLCNSESSIMRFMLKTLHIYRELHDTRATSAIY